MKIYIAGSFSKTVMLRKLGVQIRNSGHDVFVFCDAETETFKMSERLRGSGLIDTLTPASALQDIDVYRIGMADWVELEKAELVIIALPCGKSAHLEGGYAKGRGKKVCVYGEMVRGDFDAMYVMIDRIFGLDEFEQMMTWIESIV